ncbi:MAG TPA: cytochrome c peroxidase [Kofleriaceae bacterium]|nr:cytochrome c peroxidase [Kofleriaceae bacterium]
MSTLRTTSSIALSVALGLSVAVSAAGCVANVGGPPGGDDSGDDDGTQPPPPPPPEPPPPAPAIYKRGSLQPVFQLTPRGEYGRFVEGGVTMADADFISTAGNFVTTAQKMDEIGAQLGRERGVASVNVMPRAEDRQRAQQIPFRGNPSDVDIIRVDGRRKAYLPLGGDLMTPGNEIASVDLDSGVVTRIKVGVRPQRIAIHPAGLVFVCNQYSNYISIIDPRTDTPLRNAQGNPIEVATEYYCSDLAFVPRSVAAQDVDEQDLYVGNGWRGSVLKYGLTVTRDGLSDDPVDVRVTNPAAPNPANQPAVEITGVGANPYRLSVGQNQRQLYVANNRGGELALIDLGSNAVRRIAVNAPVPDIIQVNDIVIVPTTAIDRGLPDGDDQQPTQITAAPVRLTGMDGQQHVAHPGALFDNTKAYNFEDVKNGMLTIDAQLPQGGTQTYFTDDVSPEPGFVAGQKILQGALPQAVVVNAARTRAYVAMSGSDSVQEFSVRAGALRLADGPTPLFRTAERPFALALDEAEGELLVANWGGETLEVFDTGNAQRLRRIDLGYATADYPATNIERGEFFFYNTAWSNNGRKSCATCHFDELLLDGIGYANGATAPTAYHKVPANFNLLTTDSYFWNGSFSNGTYTSLAADAQTRTNCELILFGLTEGIASDPNQRVGDPANRVRNGNDAQCRPDADGPTILPDNFQQIANVIAQQKLVRDQVVRQATGRGFAEVSRVVDFYSVSEMRLPPNPLTRLAAANELDAGTMAKINHGQQLFTSSGCANCHQPNNARAPFTDGLEHGAGSDWRQKFVDTYLADPRIVNEIGGIPQVMLEAISGATPDREINVHLDPIDFFTPFCFDVQNCLTFEDPLAVRGNNAAESDRLDALVTINLANADRGFVPGNLRGSPATNTPSLRGIWFQTNYLRHGHAHTLREAILAPGHPALTGGEKGFAVDALGNIDVHGATSTLSATDVDDLYLYLQTIE